MIDIEQEYSKYFLQNFVNGHIDEITVKLNKLGLRKQNF